MPAWVVPTVHIEPINNKRTLGSGELNFAIRRDLVFTRRGKTGQATDWDRYHKHPARTARFTRQYAGKVLPRAIRQFASPAEGGQELSVVKIGGANSRFVDGIMSDIGCRQYDVVDTNVYGLSLLGVARLFRAYLRHEAKGNSVQGRAELA
jgi:hypothetical protein